MAGRKEPRQPAQPKPKLIKSPWIPGILAVGLLSVSALYLGGYIDLPHLGGNLVYEIHPDATIGVPCRYDFADALIPSLDPNYNGGRSGYTFYLGSGIGFPPMGLVLGPDGILKGTPTGTSDKFQVCVKDVGGNSACRVYHLAVNPESEEETSTTAPSTGCVIDPQCGKMQGSAIIEGVFVSPPCDCPSGTYLYETLGDGSKYCACQ